ncbi:MAG: Na+/H+ antiporter subunit E [Pseudomonadota bacterium]
MKYTIGLALMLAVTWLAFSGHYTPLLLWLGAVSILISVALALRLEIVDREGAPYFRLVGLALYMPWLLWEIAKANYLVVRACLKAEMDIRPTLVKIKTGCESDLSKTLFANSITLTPGTVTIAVDGDKLLVHALYEDAAQPEAFDEMDRRSRQAMDGGSF